MKKLICLILMLTIFITPVLAVETTQPEYMTKIDKELHSWQDNVLFLDNNLYVELISTEEEYPTKETMLAIVKECGLTDSDVACYLANDQRYELHIWFDSWQEIVNVASHNKVKRIWRHNSIDTYGNYQNYPVFEIREPVDNSTVEDALEILQASVGKNILYANVTRYEL